MEEKFIREQGLISENEYKYMANMLIFIFGLGGVGGYAFNSLVRLGIRNFVLIDKDTFDTSNINRQLLATNETIGMDKVNIYKNFGLSINENAKIISLKITANANNIEDIFDKKNEFEFNSIFVVDCIDDLKCKLALINYCDKNAIKIISSMGTANHISSKNLKIDDIYNTKYCPLARFLRNNLKKMGVKKLPCVYFDEEPIKNEYENHKSTISYIPAMAGMKLAEYIVTSHIKKHSF